MSSERPSTAQDGRVPCDTRRVQNAICDSTRWNDVKYRQGDIVICTYSKAGTTWLQQIVGQLLFAGELDVPVMDLGLWIENRLIPKDRLLEMLEAQTHRRFMKTHLPADALPFSEKAKYLYVGRDGRDVLWSWYDHHATLGGDVVAAVGRKFGVSAPGIAPPKRDVRMCFHDWLDYNGYPLWPFWSHVQSWWSIRGLANVLLLHFNELKKDLPGQIGRIAQFLEIPLDPGLLPIIVAHCEFDYMKRHAVSLSPNLEAISEGATNVFVSKGTNGRWRGTLTAADIRKYEDMASLNLTPDCARWLATGELDSDGSARLPD
jgi:aryl sulfotransferase